MKKSLLLVRHAQSINLQSGIKDIDRTLTEKGIQDAYKIGKHLSNIKLTPELIFTSHALHAVSTAQLIAEQTGIDDRSIVWLEDLYEASLRILLKIINQLENKYNSVLIIGHNPSISFLSEFLTNSNIGEIEPAGVCILNFNDMSWENIDKGCGEIFQYLKPSEINL